MKFTITFSTFLITTGFLFSQNNTTNQAVQIIEKSIKAQGGKDLLKNIKTLYSNSETVMDGRNVNWVTKEMAPNKGSFEIVYQGRVVYQSFYDGKTGYDVVNGQKTVSKPMDSTMENQKGSNYTLVYEFPYSGEVLVNDVLIDKSRYGTLNGTEFINYFILDNGEQTIKTELKANKGTISSESLKKVSTDFGIYNADINNGELQYIQLIQKLNFPDLKAPVPIVSGQWNFKANLPFKLEGWKNSEDLSKWDKDKLEKEVVAKYNELREILNSGNSGEFVKELAFANKEFFIANYYSESKKNEFLSNLSKDFSKQKGLVPPIENYKLRIMGNGKVVALESLSDNDSQGVLTTKDIENKKIYVTYIMLHKPQNSDKFQIVRYLAYNTSLLNR